MDLSFDVALVYIYIQLSFHAGVFTQYMQMCFQSKCYIFAHSNCTEGCMHFSASHYSRGKSLLAYNFTPLV